MPAGDDAPIRIGVVSETGRRDDNQDFAGASLGTPAQRALRGTVAALADGVGGARGGRAAAESAVRASSKAITRRPRPSAWNASRRARWRL